ncbi:MAG: hypothetical protein LBD17_04010 [Endomicrobium sp.]|jgi:hypothetical protein|nr:hypothetical protein [Endomicrobium sp.]
MGEIDNNFVETIMSNYEVYNMFFGLYCMTPKGEPLGIFEETYTAPSAIELVKLMIFRGGPFIMHRTIPDYIQYVTKNYKNFLNIDFTFTEGASEEELCEEYLTQLVEKNLGKWEK